MGTILTLFVRLVTFVLFVSSISFIPYTIWRLPFWSNITNQFAKIALKIVFIVIIFIVEFIILTIALASIWSYEQSTGTCYGFSCPVKW